MRILVAALAAAAVLLAVQSPATAKTHKPGQEPSPTPTPVPIVVDPSSTPVPGPTVTPVPGEEPFPEPEKPGFFELIDKIKYAISQWFANLVTGALEPVFDFIGKTVFSTPDVASNERIVELWGFSLAFADALLLLFLLAGAGMVTISGGLATQLSAKELLPRLLVAAIAANVSLIVLRLLTDLSNALAQGVLGASLQPEDVSHQMVRFLSHAALGNPFLALLALAMIVFAILVIITYIIRAAALVVLTSAAPLLLVCHALPQTETYAQTWWRAILALLLAPVGQSLLLAATFRVLLSGSGILGLPIGSGFIDIIVIGTLLYFQFKLPFWMLRAAFSGSGSRAVIQIKRATQAAVKAVTPG